MYQVELENAPEPRLVMFFILSMLDNYTRFGTSVAKPMHHHTSTPGVTRNSGARMPCITVS